MSAELWGSRVKLKLVMNRAIFSGDRSCRGKLGQWAKGAEEAHGEGTQGGTGAVTRTPCVPPPPALPEKESTLLPASGFYPAPAATGTLRIGGVHKASLASSPFLCPAVLMFLKMGNFKEENFKGEQEAPPQPGVGRKRSAGEAGRLKEDQEKEGSGTILVSPACHTGSDAPFDLGRGLVGWVLGAVVVGDALGDPASSVTGGLGISASTWDPGEDTQLQWERTDTQWDSSLCSSQS